MAEFMLATAAADAALDIVVDSAGTSAWEIGNPIDPRAKEELARHGVTATGHTARTFNPSWFAERDLILALDTDHYEALRALAPSPEAAAKVRMLRSFDPAVAAENPENQGIYDPWYGDAKDFQASWDMIAGAIPGILAHATAAGRARG
ncbi:protein tyrosine phosphatase [Arthrobacter sp. PAMC 25486]|nr:protein tyrosine phosphatase [Arthrobacter sp. PAMC 25486]